MGTALAIVSAIGTFAGGINKANTAKANADAAKKQAAAIRNAAEANAITRRRQFESAEAKNVARIAARGLSLSGSPMEVLEENAFNFERDELIQRYNAEVQAVQQENRARVLKSQSRSILGTSLIKSVGTGFLLNDAFSGLKIPKLGGGGSQNDISNIASAGIMA